MRGEKVLVVLSGGQDSTTCLFWACKEYGADNVHTITFDYGQRHRIELAAAARVAEMAGIYAGRREVAIIPNILLSTSPLVSGCELEQYTDAGQMEAAIGTRRELTFVPMRNALFLTVAANRAEAFNCSDIVLGICQMDNANYDDCRQVFLDAAEQYVNTALGHDHRGTQRIHLLAPLMNLTKAETVQMAHKLPGCWDALAYSHTSYDGTYPPTDMNHANVLRAQGFLEAGLPDPLVLRAWREGLMKLPDTANYSHSARAHAFAEKVL